MLAQVVIIPKALMMKSKKLMCWVIFVIRKPMTKFQVVENPHLVEPMLSVLRQSAGYF